MRLDIEESGNELEKAIFYQSLSKHQNPSSSFTLHLKVLDLNDFDFFLRSCTFKSPH